MSRLSAGTRLHAGTRLSATGRFVLPSQQNLVTWSQDATNASWTKTNMTTVGGFADPLGGSNAQQVTATATSGIHQIFPSGSAPSSGPWFTSSVWVKAAGSGVFLQFGVNNGNLVTNVNPATGAFSSTSAPLVGHVTAVSAGGGWFRVSLSYQSSLGTSERLLLLSGQPGVVTFAGTGAEQILLFGFQRNNGNVATPYIATTTAAVNTGTPRWAVQ